MTNQEKQQIVERVARKYVNNTFNDTFTDVNDIWGTLAEGTKGNYRRIAMLVLQAANYFELKEAAEEAITELTAQARIDNYPAVAADGYVVQMLKAALKGGGAD